MTPGKGKQGRKAAYLSDDLPEAASQPASPPPARRSGLGIDLFLPSFSERTAIVFCCLGVRRSLLKELI